MDYQRLVSYIYSYPEGVKGRNAGFAKALVHQGQFKLNISLRGVKTDSPEMFGIYMMVADGGYRLIKLGECLVKMGQMEKSCRSLLNLITYQMATTVQSIVF